MIWVSCYYDVMLSCWFASQPGDHCKCCNKLSYKAPWVVYFIFNGFAKVYVWLNIEDSVP